MAIAIPEWKVLPRDVEVLRRLADRKMAAAESAANCELRRLWYKHDAGQSERPMVLAEVGVAFDDLPCSQLECQEEWARTLERGFRHELYEFEEVKDDRGVAPYVGCNWRIERSDYGVQSKQIYADRVSGNISSRRWEPPLKNLDGDLETLHPTTYSVNREETLAWKAHLERVFEGILPVRMRGGYWWTVGMTITAIDLVGLEPFLTFMCTNPDGVHRLMTFLRDDLLAFAEWLEREGLLSLNNEYDYIGSGSMGFTQALPQPDWREGDPVRMRDLWVLGESQETSEVSPAMFEEFVFRYQQPLIERFGRCYYGCCEGLHHKWGIVKRLRNLHRLSISPWCDQEYMAEQLGRDYVFSRKPNPTLVSTPVFDEGLIREDLRRTLAVARHCRVELIMKDVHTLCGEPHRLGRWVQLAREIIGEFY